ncbi:MAG: leucine-rich repeat domain-containing protein [Oscillospiraceae bacterium]|nr:leucine-rich repeat domain-containing protein [Oscillospiraceae bacterium]
MNTRIGKKLLSLLLVGCLCVSLLPGTVVAADAEEAAEPDSYINDISTDDVETITEEEDYTAPVSYADVESGTCGTNLTWTLDTDTGVLTISGTGAMENYLRTDAPWYRRRESVTTVVIGNGVTSIGNYAFYDCYNLTRVSIPDSVTGIAVSAFYHCIGLTSITIPDSVTSIGWSAFSGCSGLTSVTIGNSVTGIGDRAFSGCSSLTSVTIGNSVTTIGVSAFCECSRLTSVTIGNSVTTICSYAFSGCTGLTSVSIPDSVTSIGDYAFYHCTGLTDVYYGGSEDEWNAIKISYYNNPLLSATIHYRGYFGWNFRNNYDGFGYDSDYVIPEERYADVFGKAYVALAKRADEETYASMINSEWHGNCLGMSVTAVLFELGLLDWDNYSSLYITGGDLYEDGFPNVNDYYTELAWARDSFFHFKIYLYCFRRKQ